MDEQILHSFYQLKNMPFFSFRKSRRGKLAFQKEIPEFFVAVVTGQIKQTDMIRPVSKENSELADKYLI